MKTKKLTVMAMCIALAMILSYLESQIPAFVAIPGVKLGLANIVVIFALYRLGWKEAVGISLLRVLLISILFNLQTLPFSLAGAALSLAGMMALRRAKLFSCVSVSVVGGVLHNLGQILMAVLIMDTAVVFSYLPALIASGTITGVFIGLVSGLLVERLR